MIRTTSSKWVMALSVSCLLAALGVTATTFAQDAQSDAEITVAIENQFLRDATLSPLRIEVTTQEGIASLDATVRNLLEKQHAAEVAETVRGVRAVLNRIRVAPSERSPAEIEAAVKRELAQDPAAEGY
jgi:osmotically-inducible protein OsmY